MARTDSTATEKTSYKHHGHSTPISSLTDDPKLLLLADKLARQGRAMAQAEQTGQYFNYHSIPIPQKFKSIFC